MSYTAPTLRTTGDLITASIWNTDIVNNIAAMYAGGMSIASQAALDFVYASSATQLARVAGVTGAFSRVNAAGAAWEMHRLGYAPTLANALNTAAKTTIVSCTVPANDLSDGSVMTIRVAALAKNGKGSAGTVLFGIAYAGVADGSPTESAVSWATDAGEYLAIWEFQMMRVGADLWLNLIPFTNVQSVGQLVQLAASYFSVGPIFGAGGSYGGGNARKIVAPDFTTSQTLALNVTLSAADAAFYIKPQSASIRRMTL